MKILNYAFCDEFWQKPVLKDMQFKFFSYKGAQAWDFRRIFFYILKAYQGVPEPSMRFIFFGLQCVGYYLAFYDFRGISEPVFVNLLWNAGIDFKPGGVDSSESIPGLLKLLQIRAQDSSLHKCRSKRGRAINIFPFIPFSARFAHIYNSEAHSQHTRLSVQIANNRPKL